MPAPSRKPAVSDSDARRAPAPSSRPHESSLIQLLPTAIARPMATPLTTRPTKISTGAAAPRARSALAAIVTNGAGANSRRRPKRSDSGPPIISAGTIPTT